MPSRRAMILQEVEKTPATSRDIADAIGISSANAAAVLSQLYRSGHLERTLVLEPGRRGRPEALYRIKPRRAANA